MMNTKYLTRYPSFYRGFQIRYDIKTLYRMDGRSPDIVLGDGFTGALSDHWWNKIFGPYTIFTAGSVNGLLAYFDMVQKEALKPNGRDFTLQNFPDRKAYTYSIDAMGLSVVGSQESFNKDAELFSAAIVNNYFRGKLIGGQLFSGPYFNVAHTCYSHDQTDECIVRGPISASRIKYQGYIPLNFP